MNGSLKPPVYNPFRSNTVQAMLTTHKDYAKWKKRAEEHNQKYPGFGFNFEKKWAEAKDVPEIIEGLKAQAQKAEAATAASKIAQQAPPTTFVAAPAKITSSPVLHHAPKPTPVHQPQTGPAQDILSSMFTGAPLPSGAATVYVPPDPYAGLTPTVKAWAVGINSWNQASGMAGVTGACMTRPQQDELTNWVLARRTGGNQQKFVVIIGQGSGQYSAYVQFKVVGYSQRSDGKAMTYHISLAPNSYRPPLLPADFGF
jgi:hypothetical protein